VCFWQFGLFAVGSLFGFVIANVFLSFADNGTIENSIGRSVFIMAVSVVFGLLILHFEKTLLAIGTSTIGSYAAFFGLDIILKTGFTTALRSFVGGYLKYQATGKIFGMLAGFFVLVIISFIYQRRHHVKS
jgi:hypothetical protein